MVTETTTEVCIHCELETELETELVEELGSWLRDLVSKVAPEATGLGIRLIDDREMSDLNSRYRHRPGTTDVLSFPASEGEPCGEPDGYLGDIAISLPVASKQAQERDLELGEELRYLMIHGVLHCLGYDHEIDNGEMEALEQQLRSRFVGH